MHTNQPMTKAQLAALDAKLEAMDLTPAERKKVKAHVAKFWKVSAIDWTTFLTNLAAFIKLIMSLFSK